MKTRITQKSLIKMIQEVIKDEKWNLTVLSCDTTRFTVDQYEGGACRQIVRLKNEYSHEFSMLCFHSKKSLEFYLNNDYKLSIKPSDLRANRHEWELDIVKK